MAFILKKSVVLVGMMGAGKTAVGTALARQLGVQFCDSDDEIVQAANMSIPDIFSRDGEAFFRKREAEVLERLLKGSPCILSTGGGAFLSAKNRDTIAQFGVSLWLKADLDLLWTRVRHRTTRPLLQTSDPRRTLAELCKVREHSYQQAALMVTSEAFYSIEDMASKVVEKLLARPDLLEQSNG